MSLTHNADYRIRNLAYAKYIRGNGESPNVLGQYTLAAGNANFTFTAVEIYIGLDRYFKFKNGTKYWTVSATNDGALTLEDLLAVSGNAHLRQCFKLIQVSQGVFMLEVQSLPNSRVQLAGPLDLEGRYIQIFPNQVNHPSEQFAFELVGSAAVVDTPVIRKPVYSDDDKIYVENVEAGASIQLYSNDQALGPQRTNNTDGTTTLEVSISPLPKGTSLKIQAFKGGESPSTSAVVKVEEYVEIIRVRPPTGSVVYNVEIMNVESGNTNENVVAARFDPPKILVSNLASVAAAEAYMQNNNYVKTQPN